MNLPAAALLGVVQGLTEFLPVSMAGPGALAGRDGAGARHPANHGLAGFASCRCARSAAAAAWLVAL